MILLVTFKNFLKLLILYKKKPARFWKEKKQLVFVLSSIKSLKSLSLSALVLQNASIKLIKIDSQNSFFDDCLEMSIYFFFYIVTN